MTQQQNQNNKTRIGNHAMRKKKCSQNRKRQQEQNKQNSDNKQLLTCNIHYHLQQKNRRKLEKRREKRKCRLMNKCSKTLLLPPTRQCLYATGIDANGGRCNIGGIQLHITKEIAYDVESITTNDNSHIHTTLFLFTTDTMAESNDNGITKIC